MMRDYDNKNYTTISPSKVGTSNLCEAIAYGIN
jgi:hypothetical protein